MSALINACFQRYRSLLLILFLGLLWGLNVYMTIPKESRPDIKIPIMYVAVHHEGISPQDSERLILKPLEKELKSIDGLKELRSTAYENGGSVILEFRAGFNSDKARLDVKDAVDKAKPYLPPEADQPIVNEINLGLFPILVIKLSGDIPKRTLYYLAKQTSDLIESQVPQVLKAEIVGDQEEVLEIIVDPFTIQSYGLTFERIFQNFSRNHQMISAGTLNMQKGAYPIKVPGLLEKIDDFLNLPVKSDKESVVHLKDIASINRTFKDPRSFARDAGVPAVSIEIVKRTGENLIETVSSVRKIVAQLQKNWPEAVVVNYQQDESDEIKDMLNDLQNNIIFAVLLVIAVTMIALGLKPSILVGIAVPGSFLLGMLFLSFFDVTLNIIVLFSLIFSVGMLVDAAIIVVEYAQKKLEEGLSPFQAYRQAAQRMAWPAITSTITIVVVFLPLLFWPGVVGQFMRFMPITLIAVLSASLLMAIIFVPVIGALLAKQSDNNDTFLEYKWIKKIYSMSEACMKLYMRLLKRWLEKPMAVIWGGVGSLVVVVFIYQFFGHGVEFFPSIEPSTASIQIRARGNLSIEEKGEFVAQVEKKVINMPELKSIYSRTGSMGNGSSVSEDTVGLVFIEFIDWKKRRPAMQILQEINMRLEELSGVQTEIVQEKSGPSSGKAIQLQLTSYHSDHLQEALKLVRQQFESMPGLINVDDNSSVPKVEWRLAVDREQAAKFGVDIVQIGAAIKFATNGARVGYYRPDDSKEELDIIIRFPKEYRTLSYLNDIKIQTEKGPMPISLFVHEEPGKVVSKINRIDSKRYLKVEADLAPNAMAVDQVVQISNWISQANLPQDVFVSFKGEESDRQESMQFLLKAFGVALFFIAIILVTQFNSFFSMGLILSSVIMSTIGVLIGLMIHQLPFGVVMGGIGVIALAGIIVSNNIILIDTYDLKIAEKKPKKIEQIKAIIIETCYERVRPVVLTQLTVILGLLPVMFQLNIDFFHLEITVGAPSSQWWVTLSTAIVYGVLFASLLTLFVTPAALLAKANKDYGIKNEAVLIPVYNQYLKIYTQRMSKYLKKYVPVKFQKDIKDIYLKIKMGMQKIGRKQSK